MLSGLNGLLEMEIVGLKIIEAEVVRVGTHLKYNSTVGSLFKDVY